MSPLRHILPLAVTSIVSMLASLSSEALASENYPPEVKRVLGLAEEPPCTLCHLTDKGEDGTVKRPFGLAMLAYGATGNSGLSSLRKALETSEAEGRDSDGDGTPDIEELRNGTDPNEFDVVDGGATSPPPAVPGETPPLFETGCSVSRSGAGAPVVPLAGGAALLAFAIRISKRGKSEEEAS